MLPRFFVAGVVELVDTDRMNRAEQMEKPIGPRRVGSRMLEGRHRKKYMGN